MTVRRPVERYGAPRPWVRSATILTVVLLAVAGGAWLLWAALYHARPDVAARPTSFQVVAARTVTVTIQVERRPGLAVSCLLQAQASDHGVVGEVVVRVPSGPRRRLTLTRDIPTERLATAVVLDRCTAQTR